MIMRLACAKNLPIRIKLPLILVSTCIAALLLAGSAFLVNQRNEAKQSMVHELSILANIIGNRSTAALIFDDQKLAHENLAVLATLEQIDRACIFRGADELFSSYVRSGDQVLDWPILQSSQEYTYIFGRDYFDLLQPIELEGKQLGYVYIKADLHQYKVLLRKQLLIALVITVTVALLAYLFSSKLLKNISVPVAELAEMAGKVAKGNDYSIRAPKSEGRDEISSLIHAFNNMLSQIEKRDSALRDSEKRFRTLVDQAMDAFFLHDNDGLIIDVNHRACLSTGYSREELLGMRVTDIDIQAESLGHKNTFWDGLSAQQTIIFEGLHRRKDGTTFPVEIALGKFQMEGQIYLSGLARDISERKQAEEMMIQTEKMMSVGGLAAGMAHEINNPLGVRMHASQNIERRFSTTLAANLKAAEKCGVSIDSLAMYVEERRILEIIKEIRDAGERAAKIVSNMLQFSRRSESLMQPASLSELIDQTVDLAGNDYDLKKKFDFRQIEILRQYESDMPLVPVIWTEVEQVILNVLRNGAQAMNDHQHGPGEKSRFIITLQSDHDMARIEIEDSGPGMSEVIRKRVFEPFFTTKPVGLGTGLGLSVSFMIIVNNHKGTMEVESEPGAGAKFIITLPLLRT